MAAQEGGQREERHEGPEGGIAVDHRGAAHDERHGGRDHRDHAVGLHVRCASPGHGAARVPQRLELRASRLELGSLGAVGPHERPRPQGEMRAYAERVERPVPAPRPPLEHAAEPPRDHHRERQSGDEDRAEQRVDHDHGAADRGRERRGRDEEGRHVGHHHVDPLAVLHHRRVQERRVVPVRPRRRKRVKPLEQAHPEVRDGVLGGAEHEVTRPQREPGTAQAEGHKDAP